MRFLPPLPSGGERIEVRGLMLAYARRSKGEATHARTYALVSYAEQRLHSINNTNRLDFAIVGLASHDD
jgi:hypothetical protein